MIHAICDPMQKDLSIGPLENLELKDVIQVKHKHFSK